MAATQITVLMDDAPGGANLAAEHGLSIHLSTADGALLLDTGQTGKFIANAEQLGIDLTGIDHVALSHGHYDHTGGLPALLAINPKVRLWRHPDTFEAKYARAAAPPHRWIGVGAPTAGRISRQTIAATPQTVLPNLRLTGEIPRQTDEDTGGDFFTDADCTIPDPVPDDQAVVVDTATGPVVVLGCAHAGVINTLKHVAALLDTDHIRTVIGGMHLLRADDARLTATVNAFDALGVELVVPLHCTGAAATAFLQDHLGDRCVPGRCGDRFVFE